MARAEAVLKETLIQILQRRLRKLLHLSFYGIPNGGVATSKDRQRE
jgi:hypothetical protein